MKPLALVIAAACVFATGQAALQAAGPAEIAADDGSATLPALLSGTGLFEASGTTRPRADLITFSPQYPLWSDGSTKRRWLQLPAGTFIDASAPDAWEFPRGTKLWKEFAHGGKPVETRFIERRQDGSWQFAAYIWNEAGTDAQLAPVRGVPDLKAPAAPGGRYAIPARFDCIACHGSTTVPVLGFTALQLSPERDPLAANAQARAAGDADLRSLVSSGRVRGLPAKLVQEPPRIPAATPVERAALGYLHGNCAHCHNTTESRVPLRLTLAQRAGDPAAARDEVLRSTVSAPSRYPLPSTGRDSRVVAPSDVEHSTLAARMQSRDPRIQMPPLGTTLPDPQGLALVHRWITQDPTRKETTR